MATPSDDQGPPRQPAGDPWAIVAYLLSGLLVYGGAGLLLDRWLGTSYFTLIGLLVGLGAALYLVYIRYVKP